MKQQNLVCGKLIHSICVSISQVGCQNNKSQETVDLWELFHSNQWATPNLLKYCH